MNTVDLIEKSNKGDPKSQLKLGQILIAQTYPVINTAAVEWLEKLYTKQVVTQKQIETVPLKLVVLALMQTTVTAPNIPTSNSI